MKSLGRIALISNISLVLVYISGLYLLIFDSLLRKFGYFHWIILLAYLIVIAVTALIYFKTRNRFAGLAIGVFALLMFIAQISDAALNLPISGFKGTNGFAYLFGFGTTPLSSFGTSMGFTVFLVFNIILAVSSFYAFRSRQ